MSSRDPRDLLPLSAPMLNVFLALGRSSLHGYAIMQSIDEKTGGLAVILPGTLYSTLNRMLDDGLIVESTTRPAAADDDRRRRYYEVTPFGQRVAAAEAERLDALLALARRERLTADTLNPREG